MLLERHVHYTNSTRAKALLDDFEGTLSKIVKVTPRDYVRALNELRAEEAAAAEAAALPGGDD